jgi:hypothetical protein
MGFPALARLPEVQMRAGPAVLALALAGCFAGRSGPSPDEGAVVSDRGELDLGPVLVGTAAQAEVRVQNRGRATGVPVVQVDPPFRAELDPIALPPGGVASVRVTFAPEVAGAAAGRLRVSIPGVGGLAAVDLTGEGASSAFDMGASLDLGRVEVGAIAARKLQIRSLTRAPLRLQITAAGKDPRAFSPSARLLVLPPQDHVDVLVEFRPDGARSYAAVLQVRACESCAAQDIRLAGTGVLPVIDVRPTRVDVGHVLPGESATAVVRLAHTGAAPVDLTSLVLLGTPATPFSLGPVALPAALGVIALDIPVTFAPRERGTYTVVLRALAAGQVLEVPIQADCGDGGLTLTPPTVDFGVLPAGEIATATVVLHDGGTGTPFTQRTLTLEGDGAAFFRAQPSRGLPTTARGSDLRIDLRLEAGAPGEVDAALVIDLEGDLPRRVPLHATVTTGGFCDLEVDPPVLRIGLATVGRGRARTLRLRNRASSECLVTGLELSGSPSFTLPGIGPDRAFSIAGGDVQELEVRFDPTTTTLGVETATLRFRQTHRTQPWVTVPVSGAGTAAELSIDRAEVAFPGAPAGAEQLVAIGLRNPGPFPLELDDQEVVPGGTDLSLERPAPATLPAGESGALHLRFHANDADRAEAELLLHARGVGSEPWVVPLSAQATLDGCGSRCVNPVASCPPASTSWLERELHLAGAARHPQGQALGCTWRVTSAPPASTATARAEGPCAAVLSPDREGTWGVDLTASDVDGHSGTCRTHVEVVRHGGLWIESRWDVDDDVDLHVFGAGAGPLSQASSWRTGEDECWEGDPALARGASWVLLDRGGLRGPEVARFHDPQAGDVFRVGLHWPSTRHGNARVQVTTVIRCGGAVAARLDTTLDEPYAAVQLGTVTFADASRCTFTPDPLRTVVPP